MFSPNQLLLLQEERERQLAREWQHQKWLNEAKQTRQRPHGQKVETMRLGVLARGLTRLVRAGLTILVSRKGNPLHRATSAESPIHFPNGLNPNGLDVDSNDSQAA